MRRCALPVPAAMAIVVAIFGCQSLRRTYVPLEGAAIGGDSFGSGGGAQNGANAGPIVTFTEPPSRVKGGSAWAFDYTVTSPRKIAAVQLQYARDGDALTDFIVLDPDAASGSYAFERIDTGTARLRLIAVDSEGKLGASLSQPFTIDSTPPLIPTFSLTRKSACRTASRQARSTASRPTPGTSLRAVCPRDSH